MPKFAKKREHADEDSGQEQIVKPSKKAKGSSSTPSVAGAKNKDADGNPYWEISAKRRVTTSKFNKMLFVNIREYYDADGELKPGKKGISLSVDQYKALLKAIPGINAELRQEGHEIDGLDASDAGDELKVAKPKKPSKRANIEATSDEGSD